MLLRLSLFWLTSTLLIVLDYFIDEIRLFISHWFGVGVVTVLDYFIDEIRLFVSHWFGVGVVTGVT